MCSSSRCAGRIFNSAGGSGCQCLQRTGVGNEGKSHLRYVYANDSGFSTADRKGRAAFRFAPPFEQWLPERPSWEALRSNSF